MDEMVAAPLVEQDEQVNPDYARIAEKVRLDTQLFERPLHIEELGALFPERTPEEIIGMLTELIKLDTYADIKVTIAPSGAAFLYSEEVLASPVAKEKIARTETQDKIAEKVRQDTQNEIRLTEVKTLYAMFPDMEPDQVRELAVGMLGDPHYADIRQIVGPTGIPYLYSERAMTANYATLLARVEARDPYALVAATVREESRVYPRPTKVALFYEPVFQIPEGQLEMVVEGLLRREEYQDIKKIVATTGAIYLYSQQFMDPDFAQAWVQWEEVERFNNP